MIKTENHLGYISFSGKYLKTLIRKTAESCFGVAGMNPYGAKQGLKSVVGRLQNDESGVILHKCGNKLVIELHISVVYGVNIAVISDSITNKVRYAVEDEAGVPVERVDVYVDGMKS